MNVQDTVFDTAQAEQGLEERRRAERRQKEIPVAVERRQGGDRRRRVNPVTTELDYNDEQVAFMMAVDQYKRANRRPYPSWSEVLAVAYALGYRKIAEATALPGRSPRVSSEG